MNRFIFHVIVVAAFLCARSVMAQVHIGPFDGSTVREEWIIKDRIKILEDTGGNKSKHYYIWGVMSGKEKYLVGEPFEIGMTDTTLYVRSEFGEVLAIALHQGPLEALPAKLAGDCKMVATGKFFDDLVASHRKSSTLPSYMFVLLFGLILGVALIGARILRKTSNVKK